MPSYSLSPLRPPEPTPFPSPTLFQPFATTSSMRPASSERASARSSARSGTTLVEPTPPCSDPTLAVVSASIRPSGIAATASEAARTADRKSTRLNSSDANISYAVLFFKSTATPGTYTLSLPDALPAFRPDLLHAPGVERTRRRQELRALGHDVGRADAAVQRPDVGGRLGVDPAERHRGHGQRGGENGRSEEHTSELQ